MCYNVINITIMIFYVVQLKLFFTYVCNVHVVIGVLFQMRVLILLMLHSIKAKILKTQSELYYNNIML